MYHLLLKNAYETRLPGLLGSNLALHDIAALGWPPGHQLWSTRGVLSIPLGKSPQVCKAIVSIAVRGRLPLPAPDVLGPQTQTSFHVIDLDVSMTCTGYKAWSGFYLSFSSSSSFCFSCALTNGHKTTLLFLHSKPLSVAGLSGTFNDHFLLLLSNLESVTSLGEAEFPPQSSQMSLKKKTHW